MAATGLIVSGVGKSYGSVRALEDVSVSFAPGSIHAVLGENGAGKSTLMHILAGFARPDSGQITFDGSPLRASDPMSCRKLGIAMIHQHFTLVPGFTVEDNLALAHLPSFGVIDKRELVREALEIAKTLGWDLDLSAVTGRLPVGARQRIEILKNISGDCRIAIFDEPTAVLGEQEVEDLFRVLRRLKEAGKTVILIAHKLREVMAVADRVTVLRRGRVVAEAEISDVTTEQLATWMVGDLPPQLDTDLLHPTAEGLTVKSLLATGGRGDQALRGLSFQVQRGEVLGIGGVDGNGQVELAEAIAGVRQSTGEIAWEGVPIQVGNPRIAYIPQDRQTDGLALSMSVEDNLMIAGYRRPELTRGPVIRRRLAGKWSADLVERFGIKIGSVRDAVSSLSGGNQQKVVVARSLDQSPDLLIAVNPSRGLDLRAAEYVHRMILEARDQRAAVLLISTDLDELAALSGRRMYLSRGKIAEGDGAVALVGGTN